MAVSLQYPAIKLDLTGRPSLKGLTEVTWHRLEYGATYAVIGQFHSCTDGKWAACLRYAVTATYQGQLPGDPRRFIFHDTHDQLRLVVSSPEFTMGITTSRVYKIRSTRTKQAA